MKFRYHCVIHDFFFSPFLQSVFSVTPLNGEEWFAVMKMSIPVVLLDEVLKFIARKYIDGTKENINAQGVIIAWTLYLAYIWYSGF